MGNHIFDVEKIENRLKELKDLPSFKPERHEPVFTVTQQFEDIEVTASFVVRNGEMVFYDTKSKRI